MRTLNSVLGRVSMSYDVLMGITELNGLKSQAVKGSPDRQSRICVNYGLGSMNEERENRLVQTRKLSSEE